MKVAKIPQPWASLLMTEAIEYILPFGEYFEKDEIILVYSIEKDERYDTEFKRNSVYDLCYNEMTLGNIEELETECFLGYVKPLSVFPRKNERLYIHDVHTFLVPEYSRTGRHSADILTKECKKSNYNSISFGKKKQPIRYEIDGKIKKGIRTYDEISIPLGDEAWEELVTNESNIALYWTEEFRDLIIWINSFKDEHGIFEGDIEVCFTHGESKVVWTMINEDICKTFLPKYEPDKKTGGKHITGTFDVLAIYVEQMDCFYPEKELLDKERQKLFNKKSTPKEKEKRREWVHIIYTPMGNKR